ncbi:hypothetical protein Tco_1272005 [Tanacetum coccineum]
MHTYQDDYLINTLRFVSAKEETQIYGAILPESLTNPEMKETKAYKTYLFSTKEPTRKLKRVKGPTNKSTKAPTRGVVIRETPEMPLSKKKEKDAEIVSPMDVYVHNEVPSHQTPILLTVPVSVIFDSSPVFSTVIPQSLPSFTPPPQQSTSTPLPTTEAIYPLSTLLDFASVFQFNNRVTALEKEVAELKKDPIHTQVIALVDDHLDARLGATKDEFMNFLSASLTTRIT